MSIQREEITITEFTSGTSLVFFSTQLTANTEIQERDPTIEYVPSIVTLNIYNLPVEISTFDGQNLWKLNNNNVYQHLSASSSNYITGHSYSKEVNQILDASTIQNIKTEFSQSIAESIGTANTPHTEFLFSDYNEIDDFYVDIKLNRSFATLDTLNIYNNLVNSIPTQEADTGVVFGRLMALQTIRDPEGNRIKIPLRNVPVGLFNSSEDYPTPASFSDDGDRIFLNLKESAEQSDYFNVESFNLDKNQLLRSASKFDTVPEQYKYVTKTNDEGEFVIYNAPVGSQIVMFEVDLMKQGLTRDEIALNFFPFPPDEDAVVDQIPNFSFKQFPIEVVPAWGTIQTGYTELNVTVNMDLRKWTTYFIPPVSVGGAKLESSVADSAANSLKIGVRNMAKQGYPNSNIKMTVIPNDLDRVNNQQLNWNLEFAQVRNEAEFFKFGASIIKLPANIYDPNAYRTDKDGVPVIHPSQKGVWLSAYQLKIFTDSNDSVSRTSGGYHQDGSHTYSHYDINYTNDNVISQNTSEGTGMNKFPYEKPWSVEYPEMYSIPSKPTKSKFISNVTNGRTEVNPGSNTYYLSEPSFSDGDMVGNLVDAHREDTAGGFGMMPTFNIWIPNRVAHAITKNYMYRYESGVAVNEEYTNGFQPSNPNYPDFPGTSTVVGGEKYQRLECGYGYFCRPQGWPRVARYTWGGGGEALFKPDVSHGLGLGGSTTTPGPGVTGGLYSDSLWSGPSHINDIYNIQTQNPALALDRNNILKNGGIDFYRVIDPSKENLTPLRPFVIPTFITLHTCDGVADRLSPFGYFALRNDGEIDVDVPYWLNQQNGAYPVWTPTQGFVVGTGKLRPGDTLIVYGIQFGINNQKAMEYTAVKLPANRSFNTTTNRYDTAAYTVSVVYTGPYWNNGPSTRTVSGAVAAAITPPQYWLKTNHSGGASGLSSLGINTRTCSLNPTCNVNFQISGMYIENNSNVIQS